MQIINAEFFLCGCSKSLAEIVEEATGEMPDHVVHVPAIPNPDFR